jgi:site-specific DNA-methyltransferase (cytosine-N4-specific)
MEAASAQPRASNYGFAPSYKTSLGASYETKLEDFIASRSGTVRAGKVQLIFTSPPFPLNRKKRYGNKTGEEYIEWLADFAEPLRDLLTDDGSIVLEVGNAWEPGKPVMSTLALRALLAFLDAAELNLCQQFVCHNPAKLPTPAQWVNIERIRVKDAFTHIWWMSPSERPKANNREVLTDYSDAMEKLLRTRHYNGGSRPSQHKIGKTSFLTNNGGAIPPNVLSFSNTLSTDPYRRYCREQGLPLHPARMPLELAEFFISFLTDPGDLVLDPFAGSNTTGAAAEELGRRWVAIEPNTDYVDGSRGRFELLARR